MRVIHVVRQYAPSIGGLENHVAALTHAQRALGYDVQIITLNRLFTDQGRELTALDVHEEVPIHRIGYWGGRRLFIPHLSLKQLASADILHVHGVDNLFDICALTKRVHRKPLICTTHGGFFHTSFLKPIKLAYFHALTRLLAVNCTEFIACSEADGALFRKITNKVQVIPNAVQPLSTKRSTGRDFLYVGRLSENKRVDRLLKFQAEMIGRGSNIKLHIVGPEFDVRRRDLEAQAMSLGCEDLLTVHGYLDDMELEALIHQCGHFISASEYEGFGMTMIECMAAGLIPIVHANASFQRLQQQAGVGTLVDFENTPDAAHQVHNWLSRLTDGHRMEQQLQAQAFAATFNWPAYADEVGTIYHRTLDRQTKKAARAA